MPSFGSVVNTAYYVKVILGSNPAPKFYGIDFRTFRTARDFCFSQLVARFIGVTFSKENKIGKNAAWSSYVEKFLAYSTFRSVHWCGMVAYGRLFTIGYNGVIDKIPAQPEINESYMASFSFIVVINAPKIRSNPLTSPVCPEMKFLPCPKWVSLSKWD